jgi:hypothetical protein
LLSLRGLLDLLSGSAAPNPSKGDISAVNRAAAVTFTSRQNSAPSFLWQRTSSFSRKSARSFRELTQKRCSKYAEPGQCIDVLASALTIRKAVIERFTHPGKLDLIAVEFDSRDEADQFAVPSWFGPEISADPNFSRRSLATACPTPLDVGLSDSVLEDVLNLLDQGVPGRSPAVSEANEASRPSSVTAEAPEPLQIATPGAVIDDPPQAFEAQATGQSPASKASRPRQAGTARGDSALHWQRITRAPHDAPTDR